MSDRKWNRTLYSVSLALLRAFDKGYAIHFAAFNPVRKGRSETPAIWQISLKYPTVLYQRIKSESLLILFEDQDIV